MMHLIRKLQQEGHTIVMVTHNMQIVKDHAERVIRMADGKIIEDTRKETADSEQVNRGHIGGICA